MGRFTRIGLLLALAIAVAGGRSAEAQQGHARKSVCIMAEAGQRFLLKTVGIMVFGNKADTIPIPSWKITERIHRKAQNLLGESFTVRQVAAPYEAFEPLYQPGGLFRDTDGERAAIIRKLAASAPSCDYYLHIGLGGSQVSSTNQYVSGLGVVQQDSVFGLYRCVYALTEFRLYDGKNFKQLRWERGGTDGSTFLQVIRGPFIELKGEDHATIQAVAEDPKTPEMVWKLVERSMELTVPTMLDTGATVAAAGRSAPGRPATSTPASPATPAKSKEWSAFGDL